MIRASGFGVLVNRVRGGEAGGSRGFGCSGVGSGFL